MEITVYGQQWWWAFEYDLDPDADDGPEIITANDLVIPAGVDDHARASSPATSSTRSGSRRSPARATPCPAAPTASCSQADEPGVYVGQCKEYCGLSHANMRARVVALSKSEFATWIDQQQEDQPMLAEGDPGFEGQQLFLGPLHELPPDQRARESTASRSRSRATPPSCSGHAPNLTHLMSRGVFAGAMFDL